jgi:hypothetical protein
MYEWSWLVLGALAIALWIIAGIMKRQRVRRAYQARCAELMAKYHDQQIVEAIMEGKIWQGMSQEQLLDSRGQPDDSEQTIYKTKVKLTWKYGRTGKNRFRERIFLENGIVVGWKL